MAAAGTLGAPIEATASWPARRSPWRSLTVLGLGAPTRGRRGALFADELSTYWIVTAHGLGGVLSTVHSNAEITPPLYFVLSWASASSGTRPS